MRGERSVAVNWRNFTLIGFTLIGLNLLAAAPAHCVTMPASLNLSLPQTTSVFPAGPGADLANGNCLICHSADMVLLQPTLTLSAWTAEIHKMKTAYGAPIADELVAPLATYLRTLSPPAR